VKSDVETRQTIVTSVGELDEIGTEIYRRSRPLRRSPVGAPARALVLQCDVVGAI
jgi:hypothetical protein